MTQSAVFHYPLPPAPVNRGSYGFYEFDEFDGFATWRRSTQLSGYRLREVQCGGDGSRKRFGGGQGVRAPGNTVEAVYVLGTLGEVRA
jgi:hypothetical protein